MKNVESAKKKSLKLNYITIKNVVLRKFGFIKR